MSEHIYTVSGMTCQHCVARVQKLLTETAGVEHVTVQLMPPRATVQGDVELAALQTALAETNFKIDA